MFNDSLYLIVLTFSLISICITTGLFITSCIMKDSKTILFYLAANLLVLNNIHSFSYIIDWVSDGRLVYNSNFICQLQAVVMIYSSTSHEFWASAIVMTFHYQNVKGREYMKKNFKKFYYTFFVLFNILPLIFTFIFWKIDALGQNELYCWVETQKKDSHKEIIIQVIIFILRWLNIVLCITYSVKIICFFAKIKVSSEEEKKQRRKLVFRMLLFPFLQISGEIVPTIYRSVMWIFSGFKISWMQKAIVIIGSIQSILYSLVYCLNGGMFKFIGNKCRDEPREGESILDSRETTLLRDSSQETYYSIIEL